jgi:hypothetical protein
LPTRLAFPSLVAAGVVIETDLIVVLMWARCLTAAPPLAAQGAEELVALWELLGAAVARDVADCDLVISVDGRDCAAIYAVVQQIRVLRQQGANFEILGDQVVPHIGGGPYMPMKLVPGLSSVGNRAFICRISSVGFMSPRRGYFGNQQGLQLLAGVVGGLVDVPEATRDVVADLSGQHFQGVIKFCLWIGNAAQPEFELSEPHVRVVGPEVVDLECHMRDSNF